MDRNTTIDEAAVTLGVFCVTLYLIYRWRTMTVLRRNGIPGPHPSWIYGNMKDILHHGSGKVISKWRQEFGPIFGYYYGARPHVVVSDLRLLENILVKDSRHFSNRAPVSHGDDTNNLVTLGGKEWKEVRTVLVKALCTRNLRTLVPIIEKEVNTFLKKLYDKIDTDPVFEIHKLYESLAGDIILRCVADLPSENSVQEQLELLKETDGLPSQNTITTFSICFPEFSCIWHILKWVYELLGWSKPKTDFMKATVRELINEHRKSQSGSFDLINHILRTSKPQLSVHGPAGKLRYMTDDEIVSNLILAYQAAVKGLSTALSFATKSLVEHPNVQSEVRKEIKVALEENGTRGYEFFNKLNYLEAVICESLRLNPPVTMFTCRLAATNYRYGSITIPKGAVIIVPVHEVHRDSAQWDNPEEFVPERFVKTQSTGFHPLAWQPFGVGLRRCIASSFSLLVIKIVLTKTLRHVALEVGSGMDVESDERGVDERKSEVHVLEHHLY